MSGRVLSTDQQTSIRMSRTRSVDTKPEMRVRRALHRLGYRFRLHVASLPGRPDIVLASYRTAVFVNGCFWHSHSCKDCRKPRTNCWYWEPKLAGNKRRDARSSRQLRQLGWRVLTIWECRLKKISDDNLSAYVERRIIYGTQK
ncbi:MAG: very short patch repair endonuclease [Acidobacteriaceae bacterium]